MSLNWLLSVDYQAVASHIQAQFQEQTPDDPAEALNFEHFRRVLSEHVDNLMTGEPFNEDTKLTDILFDQFDLGVIESVSVTDVPGAVARLDGKTVILPAVIIEVQFL